MKLSEYTYQNYRFLGISEGSIQTCMILPQFRLTFDVGCGSSRLTEIPRVLLTHGHLDHSSGIPYYISQRNLRRLPPAEIYTPPALAAPLANVIQLWSEIEDYEIQYKLHPVEYARYYPLQGQYYFQAFPSFHRVPSNGYTIFEKTLKLKEEFKTLPGPEIARLKKVREDLFYESYLPHITFSGDTQIEFLLKYEAVQKSRVLFLECTYIDEARSVSQAREWGHIHLDEIAKHAEALEKIQRLYLIHFSPRYHADKIKRLLKQKLPPHLHRKTIPFLKINERA